MNKTTLKEVQKLDRERQENMRAIKSLIRDYGSDNETLGLVIGKDEKYVSKLRLEMGL